MEALGKMKANSMKMVTYAYIFLPIICFFAGWLKIWIAIPSCIIFIVLLIRMVTNKEQTVWIPNDLCLLDIIPVVIIIAFWVYFSGIGGMVFQNKDHWWRNEIFNLLVTKEWPVVSTMQMSDGVSDRGLIYYIGFWLPAAVVGKVFGVEAGYHFQMIWAFLGVLITYYLMCEFWGKISMGPILCLIFFSGLDIIGCILLKVDLASLDPFMHLEWWSGFQFSSFTTQLFWVFNQAIYAWVITLMILRQETNRYVIIIWSCGLLNCTLPFVGMIPFLIYQVVRNCKKSLGDKEKLTKLNKIWSAIVDSRLLSVENIIGGIIGIISFIYLVGNISASNSGSTINYSKGYLFMYCTFIILEVGLYAFVIYPYQKKKALYWICIITLLICPWIRVGSGSDFCMRASIPALLVFMLVFMDSWRCAKKEGKKVIYWSCLLLFILGAVTSISEIWRTTKNTSELYQSGQTIMASPVEESDIMCYPNFSGDVSESLFFKYLAK